MTISSNLSAPTFDLFCRDHYTALNNDERAKDKAQWRAKHAPGSAP
jgi:hypothetical protein